MINEEKIKNLQERIPQVEVLNVPDEQEPPSLFTVNGVEVVNKHAVTVIGAQRKSGKTQFAGLQMAACISAEKQVLNGAIRNTDDVKDILYIDTEQPWRDCRRTLRRVMKTAGYCYDEPWNEHGIRCISVKDIDEADRMAMIELAIRQYRPQLVIIDGIADLIPSINDERQSKEVLARTFSRLTPLTPRLARGCSTFWLSTASMIIRWCCGVLALRSESFFGVRTWPMPVCTFC